MPKQSKFERLDPDARQEWRGHHATLSFLEHVDQTRAELKEALAQSIQSPSTDLEYVRLVGGELKALDYVLFLATNEPAPPKKEGRR